MRTGSALCAEWWLPAGGFHRIPHNFHRNVPLLPGSASVPGRSPRQPFSTLTSFPTVEVRSSAAALGAFPPAAEPGKTEGGRSEDAEQKGRAGRRAPRRHVTEFQALGQWRRGAAGRRQRAPGRARGCPRGPRVPEGQRRALRAGSQGRHGRFPPASAQLRVRRVERVRLPAGLVFPPHPSRRGPARRQAPLRGR